MSESAQDKNLPATAKRLRKAREEGNFARSKELGNLAVLGGGAALLMLLLPVGFDHLMFDLKQHLRFDAQSLAQPDLIFQRLSAAAVQWLLLALPLGLSVIAVAVLTTVASGAWVISTKPLMPDFSSSSCSRRSSSRS
jgi:flagellar biosynthesis protein FlhB